MPLRNLMGFGVEFQKGLRERATSPDHHLIELPLPTLNEALGGFRSEELTVLGGYPSHGKSALASQISFDAAGRFSTEAPVDEADIFGEGARPQLVYYATMEMRTELLVSRRIAQAEGLVYKQLLNPELIPDKGWDEVDRAIEAVCRVNLVTQDDPKQSMAGLHDDIARLNESLGPVRLAVVDYVQLLQDVRGAGDTNRVLEDLSQNLKEMARSFKMHVLAISSLNRAKSDSGLPSLASLRGSGGIEYAADNVAFVHQPRLANHALESKWNNIALLLVEKARNGPPGHHPLGWDGSRLQFRELTEYEKRLDWSLEPSGRGSGLSTN